MAVYRIDEYIAFSNTIKQNVSSDTNLLYIKRGSSHNANAIVHRIQGTRSSNPLVQINIQKKKPSIFDQHKNYSQKKIFLFLG